MSTAFRIVSVNVAPVAPLLIDGEAVATAIRKQPVDGAVEVGALGLAGDEQADLTVHGGLSKAIYAYPVQHYPFWRTVRAQARVAAPGDALPFGAMGENLSLEGLVEDQLWVGDQLHLPGCVLAVSEPRRPCFKFNAVMGFNQASKLMAQSGYCGSYLAVIQPGRLAAGETGTLVPGPRQVNLRELFRARMSSRRD